MSLKKDSNIVTIRGGVTESAHGTFTEQRTDLQLDSLNNEVFVVTSLSLDVLPPVLDQTGGGGATATRTQISTTEVGGISQASPKVFGWRDLRAETVINAAQGWSMAATWDVGPEPASLEAAGGQDWLAIIATNDFFVSVLSEGVPASPTRCIFTVQGYRAKADAATYAALVQSELLSA